jgi:hypothetical protein
MRARQLFERRRHRTRLPAQIIARIVAGESSLPVFCTVHEISPGGARLQLCKREAVPTVFWLKLDGGTYLYPCTLVWMEEDSTGVEIGFDHRSAWWEHSQRAARKFRAGSRSHSAGVLDIERTSRR